VERPHYGARPLRRHRTLTRAAPPFALFVGVSDVPTPQKTSTPTIASVLSSRPLVAEIDEFSRQPQRTRSYTNPWLNTTQGTLQLATVSLSSGQTTALQNTGGETHTFTKVSNFGGGFIPPLNQLSGNPVPAPECLQPANATNIFVEAGTAESGPTAGSAELPVGITNWECCIHPWMRMTIEVH
jgi:hypothetical protein